MARSARKMVQFGNVGTGKVLPRPRLPAAEINLNDVFNTTRQNLSRRVEEEQVVVDSVRELAPVSR